MEVESRATQPNGELLWFRHQFYPYKNSAGQVIRIDGLMDNITETKVTIKRLNTMATTDNLTGLANRNLFYTTLNQSIAKSNNENKIEIVVMLLDLDHFKEINNTLGHPAGDEILINVTQRLQITLRNTDTLARLGDDKFGIILMDTTNGRQTAKKVSLKIQQAFAAPYHCNDTEIFLGVSIGISIYPEHGDNASTLMSRTDIAMYHTKNTEMTHMFYNKSLDSHAQKRLKISSDLRHALHRNEFVLHYQPKIDLESNTVVGAEALIRWNHPEYGLIPPNEFIPLAEEIGLIIPITNWVINTAIAQSKVWLTAGHKIQMAINLSVRSFQDENLANDIQLALQHHCIPSTLLEIEITENILISDITKVSNILKKISSLGVSIAIDDFGTGYSSLAYLKKLPLNTLKIDRSFVTNMNNDENDTAIVRSTIDLAHNLGLDIIAEGIESIEVLNLLKNLGCDTGQGYHFNQALSHDDFTKQVLLTTT